MSEVLVSLWMIAFVAAALLGLFVYLAKSSQQSNERAAALLLADSVLHRAMATGPPHWGLLDGQLGQQQQLPFDPESRALLSYRLSVVPLTKHRLGQLFVLHVLVSWKDDSEAVTGVERGRGELSLERAVYVEDLEESSGG